MPQIEEKIFGLVRTVDMELKNTEQNGFLKSGIWKK
jgi:hypothetical protein